MGDHSVENGEGESEEISVAGVVDHGMEGRWVSFEPGCVGVG